MPRHPLIARLARTVLLPALAGTLAGWLLLRSVQAPPAPAAATYAHGVNRALPSVVSVHSYRSSLRGFCQTPRYRTWCDSLPDGATSRRESAQGSGVILRADGYIVTNDHVIASADDIRVTLGQGTQQQARLIGRDPLTDLAVLHIDHTGLVPIVLAPAGSTRVGDVALAIGNPFGIGQTVSQGIVSAIGRASVGASPWDDFMQTDAAINPGNSGGALINAAGELIGINARILSRSTDAQGIGFAIPAELVSEVLEDLVSDGRVRRGWLGLEVAERGNGTEPPPGLLVTAIDPDSPASRAGIQPGDILLAIDGHMPVNAVDMGRMVARRKPGTRTVLSIERDGAILDVPAVIEERPDA